MKKERNFNRRYAKEYHWLRTIFYMTFLYVVVFGFYNIFYNYKIEGRENIPKDKKKGKYIYAANHVSIFDPPMVVMAAQTPIAFMAKKELFDENEKLSWLVKRLGGFAVDRSKPEIATFKTVKDIVSTSWGLGIFPQGGTRPYGKLEGIKKGFAEIAKFAKADIIPVAIANWDGYPKLKPFTRRNVVIKVGKPISYELTDKEIMYEWAKQISELAGYENCVPNPNTLKEKSNPETSMIKNS
ncbi:1-acyl-sn-glycerol-3-phosphate acyltransferase [bacterium]|nr:1-acyl-sn-glycerol-3-phosphate acyltransferase [bacterium]